MTYEEFTELQSLVEKGQNIKGRVVELNRRIDALENGTSNVISIEFITENKTFSLQDDSIALEKLKDEYIKLAKAEIDTLYQSFENLS